MRNLALWQSTYTSLSESNTDLEVPGNWSISAVAVDVEQDALYVAAENSSENAVVEIGVWKVAEDPENEPGNPGPVRITRFTTPSSIAANPWSAPGAQPIAVTSEVVSLKLLPDTRSLVFITRAGDITTYALDEGDEIEVAGSIESGIMAAAWGPDDSLLALVTGDSKLILMTSTFDVILECPLHPTEFGEDAPITLGWGTKETQFHGSLGKSAAQAALDLSAVGASPDDDAHPRISWRGDGAFFAVSALAPPLDGGMHVRRTQRVYARDGTLQNTAEPVAGLEHVLAWRPSGNLVTSTQRFGTAPGLARGRDGRHDVVFFERNGLRHGEFGLREWNENRAVSVEGARKWGYCVREVGWSADSNVLSVWIEGDDGDVVQLWTTGNYHWYLKQEIAAPVPLSGTPGRFTTVHWHPEDALRIILTTATEVMQRTFAWETFAFRSKPPTDTGSVAVIDGASVLITSFRTQNVPPPMSSFTLPCSPPASPTSMPSRNAVPVYASFSHSRDVLALLWESGVIQLTDLRTRIGAGRENIMDPVTVWAGAIGDDTLNNSRRFRQVIFYNPESTAAQATPDNVVHLAVLGVDASAAGKDVIYVLNVQGGMVVARDEIAAPLRNGRLTSTDDCVVWQAPDGELFTVDIANTMVVPKSHFLDFCFTATQVLAPDVSGAGKQETSQERTLTPLFIGLSQAGKLNIATETGGCRTLATNANSFTIASGFLVFTTTAHVAHFAPLHALTALLRSSIDDPSMTTPEWEIRRVERGSRIVTAVPSTMSLVLQMPRGNLETINPRPLVMEIVRQDIDAANYNKAFLACRKHRIDLNALVEHNSDSFMENLSIFVEQVDDVDYINLFLTSIGQGSMPDNVVNALCDGIRVELEKRDLNKYVNATLTAHVMKRPPDHEAGLAMLLRLRDTDPQLVEDAVRYIIFLVDADRLFDTALGMYDFSLVLMVAQHAQKDPREYLPFLRELRALETDYQHFRIDDHLGRHSKALESLCSAGTGRFHEAMEYVEKHRLYDHALKIWQHTEHYNSVLSVYGDWLFERRDFSDAAFVFRQAGTFSKALVAHERALEWQELYELAPQAQLPEDALRDTAYRISEDLATKKRHAEAAFVLLDYAQDVREAINLLVQGGLFAEARRLIARHMRPELLEELVYPGLLESASQLEDELKDMRVQLRKQAERLRELRVRKLEQPDEFYGEDGGADLHNVDVMTDISMAPTTFTRYTAAPSTSSKRSSRSKRKMARKVGSGRRGTVDEEEYLLQSITRLVTRFEIAQADTIRLMPHLLQLTAEHKTVGHSLREDTRALESELRADIEEIWRRGAEVPGNTENAIVEANVWTSTANQSFARIDPLEKICKPEVGSRSWGVLGNVLGD